LTVVAADEARNPTSGGQFWVKAPVARANTASSHVSGLQYVGNQLTVCGKTPDQGVLPTVYSSRALQRTIDVVY
jgi:hypothetical protein